jgi:ADP-heptose:LPS heptosyltransferase
MAKLQVKRAALLHPLMMYSALTPVWRQRVPYAALDELTAHRWLTTPDRSHLEGQLPSRYIAVKFYASRQFPATPDNKQFVAGVIKQLAKDHHVVVLASGARLDEHEDFSFEYGERVHSIDHLLSPDTNLDTQTRIIAGATAFVGSYGGFSYLAPYFGVPAVSFYESRESFFDCHLDFARRVFTPPRGAGFVALDVRDAHLIESLLGGVRRDVELPVR